MANRKILPEDVTVEGIKIYSIVVTPKGTYDEEFILFGDSMEYILGIIMGGRSKIKWSVDTSDPAFQKKWLSIANDLKVFHMPIRDPFVELTNSFDYKVTTTSILLREKGGWWTLPIEFKEHPRIGASKAWLSVLKKIAAMVPEGWQRPYVLTNL